MKTIKALIILLLVILTACAEVDQQVDYLPVSCQIIWEIQADFEPAKCLYSSSRKTLFARQKDSNFIHIFKDGKRINTIGGMGFEQTNFDRLSDIALAPDGSLLALDSFAGNIKKFDTDGKFITEFALPNLTEPALLDIAMDETFYIFDSNKGEIVVTNLSGSDEDYRFGMFQLNTPVHLTLSGNKLVINDIRKNKTLIFDKFGQLITSWEGYFQIQNNQQFELKDYFIEHSKTQTRLCISPQKWQFFVQKGGFTILTGKSKILIGKIQYEVN